MLSARGLRTAVRVDMACAAGRREGTTPVTYKKTFAINIRIPFVPSQPSKTIVTSNGYLWICWHVLECRTEFNCRSYVCARTVKAALTAHDARINTSLSIRYFLPGIVRSLISWARSSGSFLAKKFPYIYRLFVFFVQFLQLIGCWCTHNPLMPVLFFHLYLHISKKWTNKYINTIICKKINHCSSGENKRTIGRP